MSDFDSKNPCFSLKVNKCAWKDSYCEKCLYDMQNNSSDVDIIICPSFIDKFLLVSFYI